MMLGVRGNQFRMGINAPPDVSVHRKEIYAKIHENLGPDINKVGGDSRTENCNQI